jgi:hypothetical protein
VTHYTPNNQIQDDAASRKYFTLLPNLIDDLGLSVYAFRLYVHLKRVAGDGGKSWQSARTLAKHCKMSVGKVSQAKGELLERELIKITKEPGRPGRDFDVIEIVDIWPENMAYYVQRSSGELQRSPDDLQRSPHDLQRSPGELKKNPIRRTLEEKPKEEEGADAPAASPDFFVGIYERVTGRLPARKDQTAVVESLQILRSRFESDSELVDYLSPFWQAWDSRKTKAGRPYRKSSTVWLVEWAMAGEIPPDPNPEPVQEPEIDMKAEVVKAKRIRAIMDSNGWDYKTARQFYESSEQPKNSTV